MSRSHVDRRTFLKGAGGVAAGGVLAQGLAEAAKEPQGAAVPVRRGEFEVALEINGAERKLTVEPRTTLLSALRHRVDPPLTGTKLVCDRGNCGACTVIVDGRPAYACLLLAADLEGRSIRTVEGLGSPEALSPVQAAFCEKDALMCGFCTPGFVVAVTAALEMNPGASLDEVKAGCAGNFCRCGTYPHVFDAIDVARAGMAQKGARR
jgi:aerobic-type carbon monoxide dehydrogenase small subunit (CoxS/CutS family)